MWAAEAPGPEQLEICYYYLTEYFRKDEKIVFTRAQIKSKQTLLVSTEIFNQITRTKNRKPLLDKFIQFFPS